MCIPMLPVHVCTYFETAGDVMFRMAIASGSYVLLGCFYG